MKKAKERVHHIKSNATPPQFNTSKLHETRKQKQTKQEKNMNMSKEAVETLGMTLAQTTLFLANCNGRVRVCMRISAMHLVHPFAFWKHGVPSRHTHEKGVLSHQQSSADPACIQANISPPSRHLI